MRSLRGQLLLASPRLVDGNFVRTVLLMIQHDEQGALGLVLNRPLEVTVAEACASALEMESDVDGFLHQGGPCDGPLMVVHSYDDLSQIAVSDGVFFTSERAHIEAILRRRDTKAKFFVGYAGWGAEQLESEIERGSWVSTAGTVEQIFSADQPEWSKLMAVATLSQFIDPERIPPDPSMN